MMRSFSGVGSRELRRGPVAIWLLGIALAFGFLVSPRVAFADPHAIFFTDRAQEQVFYNILAALNQADYVENPGQPSLDLPQKIGAYLVSGQQPSPQPPPALTPKIDPDTGAIIGFDRFPPLAKAEPIQLPRIRVRVVTPDDGDQYTRDLLQKRALAEAQRVELSNLLCGLRLLYLGEDGARECVAQAEQNYLDLDSPTT